MKNSNLLKCYDLCCGAGALAEGFRQGGAKILGGIDISPEAIQTSKRNHPRAVWRNIAIEEFSRNLNNDIGKEIKEANAILAGLPCQGFSVAGKGDPNDSRNTLYRYLLKIVARIRPKYVVIENVSGLLFERNSKVIESIVSGLRHLGYDVTFRILNAINFSVPQRRKRIFIIASLEYKADWVFECISHNGENSTVLNAFRYLSRKKEDSEQNHVFMEHGVKVTKKLKNLKPGGPISYRRLEWNKPSITLIAGHRAMPVHPSEPRSISVREAARIQGFKDSYRFRGSRTSQIEQVANAVPPPIGTAIAKSIKRLPSYKEAIHGELYIQLKKKNTPALRKKFKKAFFTISVLQPRRFPWRSLKDPFKILITEVLLQRTDGQLANSIWRDVLRIVPSARSTAEVDLRSLRPLIRRIGIFSRAKTIKKIASYLCEKYNGKVPQNFDELMRIPGVGLYISSAVRSFAYGFKDFPVDSNAFRFVSRFFGLQVSGKKSEARQIREFMLLMLQDVSNTKIRDYIYGFLDFSAAVCKPRKPMCGKCDLRKDCSFSRSSKSM